MRPRSSPTRKLCLMLAPLLFMISLPDARENAPPVLIELFTSQGCSSCPPADEILSTWGLEAFARGEVIPLAFHVDYWDHLGWKDPFSSNENTRRQQAYAEAFRDDSVYTPEAVVAGRSGFVGSEEGRLRREARSAREETQAALIRIAPSWNGGKLTVAVSVDPLTSSSGKSLAVYCAVFENGLLTKIPRGENSGRTLVSDFVVRKLMRLGEFKEGGPAVRLEAEFLWPAEWNAKNSGAAVFIQEETGKRVRGAAKAFPLSR